MNRETKAKFYNIITLFLKLISLLSQKKVSLKRNISPSPDKEAKILFVGFMDFIKKGLTKAKLDLSKITLRLLAKMRDRKNFFGNIIYDSPNQFWPSRKFWTFSETPKRDPTRDPWFDMLATSHYVLRLKNKRILIAAHTN